MYFGIYHFTGDTAALSRSFDTLVREFQDEILLTLCVTTDDGISIYDTCPTREEFETFSRSTRFRSALERAGLPEPRVELIGTVHATVPDVG